MIGEMLEMRMTAADMLYGQFTSTHEALGVACEEWHEFVEAIRSNNIEEIIKEAIDLASVLIRLSEQLELHGRPVRG